MCPTSLGDNPRNLEQLSLGGGLPNGGSEMDSDGNIAASGEVSCSALSVDGGFSADGIIQAKYDSAQRVTLAEQDGQMLRVRAFRPGIVFHDISSSAHWFRIGADSDSLKVSVDTDSDNAVDASEHFDDAQPVAISADAVTVDATLEVPEGTVSAGADGSARGVLTVWDGAGGSAPGCIRLASRGGNEWYLFVEDDGTLRVSSTLPALNSDGQVVGLQS